MGLTLRHANSTDAVLLYQWRTESEKNAAWYVGEATDPQAHMRWLQDRLRNPAVTIWIAEEEGAPVGMCRVDSNGEISYHVDAAHRNRGLGTQIVLAACALTEGRIKASVDQTNTAGRIVLERAGFTHDDSVLFYVRR